ncbi:MAG: 2-keto-4-pentenoate hydratase [Thermocrispum sp.]
MALDPVWAAKSLYDARQNRTTIPPFTDADPTLDARDGYAVQQQLVKLLLADGDRVVGYKAGITSKPMQQLIGMDVPDYGPVFESTLYRDGDAVPLSRFIQPKIEAEIAFVLGDELAGPGVTVADAYRATAGVCAAVEIVDSRIADWRIKIADTIADLASNGALAVSPRVVPLDGIDARLIGMMLTRANSWTPGRARPRSAIPALWSPGSRTRSAKWASRCNRATSCSPARCTQRCRWPRARCSGRSSTGSVR